MDLRVDANLPFPCATVFAAYRDEVGEVVPYLPNVRSVDVKSRTASGSRVEIVNVWRGGGEVPRAIRALLRDEALGWTDHATWDEASMKCEWWTETHAFADAIRCRGENAFVDQQGGATLLQMRGSIEIDPKKIRGIAGFLGARLGALVEEFLASKIQSNFLETSKGMTAYLERRRSG